MRAVRFEEGKVTLADVPPPQPFPGGVNVRVRAAGICGSDITMLSMGFPMAGTPGHELSGELEDGTPVAIEPLAPCGTCEFCKLGNYQVCRSGVEMIYGVGRDGGMAEQIVVPERCLVRLPRSLDVSSACLVEPLAVAIHGMRRAGVEPGMRVAIVGGGSIGLCATAAAISAGCEVGLAARHPAQKAAGARLGAGEIDGEYELAADCVGNAAAAAQACEALAPNGRLLLLAAGWEDIQLPGFLSAQKELEFVVSSMYGLSTTGRDVEAAAALLGARPEIADTLITHRFALDDAPAAFAQASRRAEGALKVVLEP